MRRDDPPRYRPIEDYGVIGDLRSVALVSKDGSIDFACLPEFDSPSAFAALLDADKGGRFSVSPALPEARTRQMYLPDTNVLLTRFSAEQGVAELTDFMPVAIEKYPQSIVRLVHCVRGEVEIHVHLRPAFDYGRADHRVEQRDREILFVPRKGVSPALRLRGCVAVEIDAEDEGAGRARFRLAAGETAWLVLENAEEEGDPIDTEDEVWDAFERTSAFWREWVSRSTYQGRWREMVQRSALILKLLSSRTYGSIIAAPTFSLPEAIGGERNWDYRFTWIRDAAFTLRALTRLGIAEEADSFMDWLERVVREVDREPPLHVMFRADGRLDLDERTLSHFEGYAGSRPVRVGNCAYDDLQLDIYGELLDAIYMHDKHVPIHHDMWEVVVRANEWVCENWHRKDQGIWEIRGPWREFLQSRVMCWVALDRGIRLSEDKSLPAPVDRWRKIRDEIYYDVYDRFWDAEIGAFVQYPGSKAVDAAALLLPLFGFLSPTDPRWIRCLEAIDEQLVEGSLVHRYRQEQGADDGLHGREGTFVVCSFWFAECLAAAGELDRARLVFEKVLGYANHLGLFAEQIGRRGEHLGNFPQALSHLGLISAAVELDRRLSRRDLPGRQRSGSVELSRARG